MKILYDGEKYVEPKENCFIHQESFKKHRSSEGIQNLIHSRHLSLTTEELLHRNLISISQKHKDKKFDIYYDGIIRFSIFCDNKLIYKGDFYDIEEHYKKRYDSFENHILSIIE